MSGDTLSPERLAAVAELWTRSGRELVVRLSGRSMEPAIPSGAEVRIQCGEGGALGDIVACREGAGVRVHRVVARSAAPGWILTRGDARWLPDAPLSGGDVLGRVVAVGRDDAFGPPPGTRVSRARRAVLWPLVAALHAHPGFGAALVRGLVRARRLALRAITPLRRRLSGRPAPPA